MTEIKTRLTQAEQQALQAKLFALLARQVRDYTKGESDSVPVETAQALLDSICFTLGLDLEDPGERGRELLARDLAKELTSRRERLRGEMVRGLPVPRSAAGEEPGHAGYPAEHRRLLAAL